MGIYLGIAHQIQFDGQFEEQQWAIYLGIAHQIQFDGQFEEQHRVLEHMLIETSDLLNLRVEVRVNLSGGGAVRTPPRALITNWVHVSKHSVRCSPLVHRCTCVDRNE